MKWIEIFLTYMIARNVRVTALVKHFSVDWDAIRSQSRRKKKKNRKQGHDYMLFFKFTGQ